MKCTPNFQKRFQSPKVRIELIRMTNDSELDDKQGNRHEYAPHSASFPFKFKLIFHKYRQRFSIFSF